MKYYKIGDEVYVVDEGALDRTIKILIVVLVVLGLLTVFYGRSYAWTINRTQEVLCQCEREHPGDEEAQLRCYNAQADAINMLIGILGTDNDLVHKIYTNALYHWCNYNDPECACDMESRRTCDWRVILWEVKLMLRTHWRLGGGI